MFENAGKSLYVSQEDKLLMAVKQNHILEKKKNHPLTFKAANNILLRGPW